MKTSRQINAERKKEGKPPLNFALFRKVIKKLETAPKAYDQEDVAYRTDDAPCGTAACIGGWAALLSGKRLIRRKDRMLTQGGIALGLCDRHWEQPESSRVFSSEPEIAWPSPYDDQWQRADTPRQRARVAIRYLKQILKTGKVE